MKSTLNPTSLLSAQQVRGVCSAISPVGLFSQATHYCGSQNSLLSKENTTRAKNLGLVRSQALLLQKIKAGQGVESKRLRNVHP